MSTSFERAKSRLDNLKAIEPLLGALRTMSLGALQMAQNKLKVIQTYESNYNHILVEILPHIKTQQDIFAHPINTQNQNRTKSIVLLIGSERGLCGKFNETLVESAQTWIQQESLEDFQFWGMGSRLIKTLEKASMKISWRKPLPASKLSTYQQAYQYTQNWIDQFENYAFNHLFILFMALDQESSVRFSTFQLLPYQVIHPENLTNAGKTEWPPPIIETAPKGIYHQIVQHYIASSFHQILLKSSAAEHSARYNLMEDAKNNAEEIISDLRMLINIERKRKITQEMQELAAGAGLLKH